MKIYLFTSQFPYYDAPGIMYATPFLFNYAKEWVAQGHDVTVFHMTRVYPAVFNSIASIAAKLGSHTLEKYIISPDARSEKAYQHEGVKIHRFMFKKYIPHGDTPQTEMRKLAKKIDEVIQTDHGDPDLVIGDFFDPVIGVLDLLNDQFNCKVCQTVHITDFPMFEKQSVKKRLPNIDYWLLRSAPQKEIVSKYVTNPQTIVMCSGIHPDVIAKELSYRRQAKKLLFVGTLHKFKGIDTLLEALDKNRNLGFTLKLVGAGSDELYFRKRVDDLKLNDCVEFVGKVSHDQVFEYMRGSDVQVMISHETFGMVYVEAMSQGCIPIGAMGEGIDGVVINGQNGFLTPLGDSEALAKVLNQLAHMESNRICQLSMNAYHTAKNMTHSNLASNLLDDLLRTEMVKGD